MRWRIIFLFFAVVVVCRINAQISEGGVPPGFNYGTLLRSEPAAENIPILFNVEDLILVDEWQVANGGPLCAGISIPAGFTMENSGNWIELPGGERVWQLRIQAKGAIALMLYYKAFDIPAGGKLFIYNADRTQVLGAYTDKANPRKDYFATEFVAGDDITLEYVPASSGETARIEIEEVGYGYNNLDVITGAELRAGASCEVNVNCPEGAAWQKEKAGICHTIQKIDGKSYICSGSLVNNTSQDFKPYVLMAFHCMQASASASKKVVSTPEEMKQWMFYFNLERQGCTDSAPSAPRTLTGCTKLASTPIDAGGDGLLVLLDQEVPEDYNVYYNGWDRTSAVPLSGVGIHHPAGDFKKISTYTEKAESATWNGEDFSKGARGAHWGVVFAKTENGHGITEGGSSGSPLFNQNHLVVGTLTGGSSTCDNPAGINMYGKLFYNWNKYSLADSARMDVWLDPESKGVETLKGLSRTVSRPEPSGLRLEYKNKGIVLSWSAPASAEAPAHYTIYRNNRLIGTSSTRTFTDADLEIRGEVIYGVTAGYRNGSESLPVTGSIVVQEYKSPTDLETSSVDGGVSLAWKAPLYTQVISWSTGSPSTLLGADAPIYFGHAWDKEDLKGVNNNTITGVEFYASKDATYSLLLMQGGRKYTQAVATPRFSGIITVDLATPFVIDASNLLIVSLYTSAASSSAGTIACDDGAAVIGKGNLISEDGNTWYVLYDGDDSIDQEEIFDYNFYLGTIVSSEKGTITKSASADKKPEQKMSVPGLNRTVHASPSLRALDSKYAQFQYPAAFPVLEGYKVYRDAQLLTSLPAGSLSYTDRLVTSGSYLYGVSAVYRNEESEKSFSSGIAVSNTEINPDEVSLSPTVFSDYINIANPHKISRLDIYSLNGMLLRQIRQPEENIDTSSLPSGMYLFKLYMENDVKTHRMIKK